jgi:hypothetical protein
MRDKEREQRDREQTQRWRQREPLFVLSHSSFVSQISGIAIAAKAINPNIRIIAAEPLGKQKKEGQRESRQG